MKKSTLLFVGLLCSIATITSQNLLQTTSWTVGSGSVTGYTQYGATAENIRILGDNHIGQEKVIWQATPDSGGVQSGGFGTSYISIDHTKDYRLSIWIKKTNSNDGHSYFKCTSYVGGSTHLLTLNGTPTNYPALWSGDLPQLDRWYLLVGYIHKSSYNSTTNLGRIYDGITGEEVQTITDLKFKSTATKLQHRAFLYGDTNTDDRQFMVSPTMFEVNGSESSINSLLGIEEGSGLLFTYDTAGNQTLRKYCIDIQACRVSSKESNERFVSTDDKEEDAIQKETDILEKQFSIYPNPTKGIVTIQLESTLLTKTESIHVYNSNSVLLQDLNFKETNKVSIDLSEKPTGVYFLHIHLNNGESITKKIIKL